MNQRKKPIYVLIDAVAEAIRKYDKSNDHSRHGPNSDCIRCRLEEVISNTFAGKPVKARLFSTLNQKKY